jgi:hypothetical protein
MGDEIHIPSTSSSTVKMKKKGGGGRPSGAKNKNGGSAKSEDKIPMKKLGRPPGAKNLIKKMKKNEGDGKSPTKSKKQLSKSNDNGVANTVVIKKKKKPKTVDEGGKMIVGTRLFLTC